MIRSKAQHIAEAQATLDRVRDALDVQPGMVQMSRARLSMLIAYARAHAAVAQALPGHVEGPDLDQAHRRLAR